MFSITVGYSCSGKPDKKQLVAIDNSASTENISAAYIRSKSFQNSDSTWGFTVFVNSRPYLHFKKIPYADSKWGFQSKEDAERIAAVFVKMLRNGDLSPTLTDSSIDSLKALVEKR